jgi:hypothetical protein
MKPMNLTYVTTYQKPPQEYIMPPPQFNFCRESPTGPVYFFLDPPPKLISRLKLELISFSTDQQTKATSLPMGRPAEGRPVTTDRVTLEQPE